MKLAVLLTLISAFAIVDGQTSAEWEVDLVEAWTTIGDCSPDTGMCDNCGFGAAVVDLNGPDGTEYRYYTAGPGGLEAPWSLEDTWEIASITKPFTAIAMLILEEEGVLTRDSTVGEFLPCDWDSANSDVASITLMELVQHMSGLPAQPPDRGPSIDGNPFGGYTEDRLCASLLLLNGLPTRGRYSYSNYAYGLLGYVLTLATDPENPPAYEDIIKEKITVPLGMLNTTVTFDPETAAPACSRGINRGDETIRIGAYETLQGNGAIRSNMFDMSKYLLAALYVDADMPNPFDQAIFGDLPPPSDELTRLYNAMAQAHSAEHSADLACACVSDWCEGNLCPLPNPNEEFITTGGFEGYHSGGELSWRKSGDTGGYSSRVAYSYAKGRGAVVADTCGGCGSKGTAGSGSQRAALLLADGPPVLTPAEPAGGAEAPAFSFLYAGDAFSHNFPSVAQINIEVTSTSDPNVVTVALSSSDGTGATSNATLSSEVPGAWIINEPIFMGTGWGASSDPFNALNIPRTLIISPDFSSATYQDMGADTYLTLVEEDALVDIERQNAPLDAPPEDSEDNMGGRLRGRE